MKPYWKTTWLRIAIAAGMPWIIVWVFFARLWPEMKLAFWFAQNDVRIEIDQMHRAFRANSMNKEEWK